MNITIVTACWRSDNLIDVLYSVDSQSYKDWQHILVNDNNSGVRVIFKDLCDNKQRFWVDIGVRTHYYGAFARSVGAMIAFSYLHHSKRDIDNEWICFLDDDNKWEMNHLSSLVEAANNNPNAVLIASDAVWVGVNDPNWREVRQCRLRNGGCDLGQFMWKTSLFRKYGYFFASPLRKHKYDWILLSKIIEGEGEDKIAFTNKSTFLMSYRKR